MKKSAFFAAFAAGLLGLAACSEQEVTTAPEAPEAGNTGFTIRATVDATKTSVDNYAVSWDEGDNMSILINNGKKDQLYKFAWTGEGDTFASTKFTPSADSSYIWYALFPYDSHFTSIKDDYSSAYINIPAKSGLMQSAPGNMSHLANMPLYGYVETKGEEVPEIKMHHLTSVIQLSIANNLTEDLHIFSIGLDNNSGALLSGTFYVNCESGDFISSGDQFTYTDVTLGLTDGTVKAGETGVFYIPVAAATIAPGKDLVFTITDNNKGKAVITKKLASGLTFNPGRYRRTSIAIDADTEFEAPTQIEEVTVAEFLEKEVSSDVYYRLTGTVANIINTTYGNFDLVDETGKVYVYGLTATKVNSNDKSFASLNIEEGDILTLEGVRGEHNSAQVGGPAYFISVVKPVKFVVDPSALVFPADGGSLTATATATNFTGDVTISAVSDNSQFTAKVSGTTITVTAPANTGSEEITGKITVTATGGNSTKTAIIEVSQNKAAPVAQDGDILWQEDFTGYGTTMPATATDNHVFGGGTVSYALTNGGSTTKLFSDALAGGVKPELLVSKNGGKFKISGIPTGSASAMTLTYRINNDYCSVSATNGVELLDGGTSFVDNVKTVVFTVPEGVSSFDLELTNSQDGNCRVDNFVLVAGAPKVKETQTISFGDTKNVEWTVGTNCTLGTPKQGLTVTGAKTAVTYASSDPSVATVTNTGMVTPLKAGVVTITATAEETDNYKKATDSYTLTIVDLNAPVTVTKTASQVATDLGITANGTQVASFTIDSNVTVSVNKNGNNGKLYNLENTAEWRLYQSNNAVVTVSVPEGKNLVSVKFTFSVSNNGILKYGDNTVTSGTAVSVSGNSASFTVANSGTATNGQIKISAFEVVYK